MNIEATNDQFHYDLMAAALRYIESRTDEQPSLEEVAEAIGFSPAHFQRIFSQWVGVSPKRYLQYLTLDHAKRLLDERFTVLDATLESGLSSPGRLHDLFIRWEAMTPGEYSRKGKGLTISWGWFDSPFGETLAMGTDRGLCGMAFAAEFLGGYDLALARGAVCRRQGFAGPLGDRSISRRRRRCSGSTRRAIPNQGVGGVDDHSVRPCHDVFGNRASHWQPSGCPRRRVCCWPQSDQLADPVPPRHAPGWRIGRLSLGPSDQTGDDGV